MRMLGTPILDVFAPVAPEVENRRRVLGRAIGFLIATPVVATVALGLYAIAASSLTAFATGVLIGGAALVAGAMFGFLFAIPRSSATNQRDAQGLLRSSTSLEEIADWLTKILVGLGLVELGKLVDEVSRLVAFLGPSLGSDTHSREPVALALMLVFSLSGFLLAYVGTRISLAGEFAHAEEELQTSKADVRAATHQLEGFVSALEPSLPSTEVRGATESGDESATSGGGARPNPDDVGSPRASADDSSEEEVGEQSTPTSGGADEPTAGG